jgi:hypothetical protein
MKLIKPAYIVSVSSINCKIEVWCNDVIIFDYKSKSSAKGTRMSISIPINHVLLQNQEFDIRAIILPAHGKDTLESSSAAQIGLYLLDYVAPKETEIKLLSLVTPNTQETNPKKKQDVSINNLSNLPKYELSGMFKAEGLPFEVNGWINSINLSEIGTQTLLTNTYKFYKRLFDIIARKDTETYFQLTNERDILLSKVYYKNQKKIEVDNSQFLTVLNEAGLEVLPFTFKDIDIQIMGKGKLVRLIRKNGFPALSLYNPISRKTRY